MSKWQPQVWRIGEDWGFEVDCFKADGVTPVPGITEVRFRMGTEEGDVISWTSGANPSTVYFTGTLGHRRDPEIGKIGRYHGRL